MATWAANNELPRCRCRVLARETCIITPGLGKIKVNMLHSRNINFSSPFLVEAHALVRILSSCLCCSILRPPPRGYRDSSELQVLRITHAPPCACCECHVLLDVLQLGSCIHGRAQHDRLDLHLWLLHCSRARQHQTIVGSGIAAQAVSRIWTGKRKKEITQSMRAIGVA